MTQEDAFLQVILDGFLHCLGFPQTIGAIDSTHILIIRPVESASDYYTVKILLCYNAGTS